jgi:hypothetical protein
LCGGKERSSWKEAELWSRALALAMPFVRRGPLHPQGQGVKRQPRLGKTSSLCGITARGSRVDYSFRSATIGSTPAARRAGMTDASNAASASSSVAIDSITGSQGLTPNS